MIRKEHWFAVGILTCSAIGLFASSTMSAQHGPVPHAAGASQQPGPGQHPGAVTPAPYDVKTEVRLTGVVVHVNAVVHGGASNRMAQESTLILKTDTGTFDVRLAPAAFLAEKKAKIAKGDTVEVIGSRVTIGDSQVVLAREIRKGSTSWTLRDAGGAPLWASTGHGRHP